MDNQKNNFIFHRNWWDSLHDESNELIGAFLRDLCQYAFCGEDSEPLPELRLSIRHAKAEMEQDVKRYQETCERNRQKAQLRWSRVKDTTACKSMPSDAAACRSIPMDAEHADNDNDNDNELSKDNNNNKETKAKKDISLIMSPEYTNFLEWLKTNCTHLLKMKIPTEVEYKKLLALADGSKTKLTDKLLAMENDKSVPKKKRSIYRTCLEWLKRDKR